LSRFIQTLEKCDVATNRTFAFFALLKSAFSKSSYLQSEIRHLEHEMERVESLNIVVPEEVEEFPEFLSEEIG